MSGYWGEEAINDHNLDESDIRWDLVQKIKRRLYIIKIIFIILGVISIILGLYSYFIDRTEIILSSLLVIIAVPIIVIIWFIYIKKLRQAMGL